jgi:hypothetical protein
MGEHGLPIVCRILAVLSIAVLFKDGMAMSSGQAAGSSDWQRNRFGLDRAICLLGMTKTGKSCKIIG